MLLPIRKGPKLAIAYARSHQRLQWLPEDPGQVPEFAEAVAADFEQRPRAQATLSPGRKYDAPRLESASDLPGRQRVRAPAAPSRNRRLSSRRRSGRCERCDRPAKQSARRTALGGGYRR